MRRPVKRREHVPRSLWVHDEGTYSVDSKIKRVLPDGNIITVAAKRFHCVGELLQRHLMGKATSGFFEFSLQTS